MKKLTELFKNSGTSEGVKKQWETRRYNGYGLPIGHASLKLKREGFAQTGFEDKGTGTYADTHHHFQHPDGRKATIVARGTKAIHILKDHDPEDKTPNAENEKPAPKSKNTDYTRFEHFSDQHKKMYPGSTAMQVQSAHANYLKHVKNRGLSALFNSGTSEGAKKGAETKKEHHGFSTGKDGTHPSDLEPFLKENGYASIDGHNVIVRKWKTQKRTAIHFHPTDPTSLEQKTTQYPVTTVHAETVDANGRGGGQHARFTFGGEGHPLNVKPDWSKS